MRLRRIISAAAILFGICCAIGVSAEPATGSVGYIDAKDMREARATPDGKLIVKRKIPRNNKSKEGSSEHASSPNSNEKGPESSSSPEDTSLPKSTTFVQARRALFDRLNKPLLRNRALDTTISKLRSRLGALASSEDSSTKKRYLKKIKKPITSATTEQESPSSTSSPISINVPREDQHHHHQQGNDSMIMIPVPASQRKPYQPVIMQVTKSNESHHHSTAAPETKVVTYKLNKMFVPMGIYGKVVGNAENTTTTESDTATSQESSAAAKGPEIRHKGTQSESSEKFTGVKVSSSESSSSSEEENGSIKKKPVKKILRKPKEHSRIADTIDITYDYKPQYDKVSIASEKPDASAISITTSDPISGILTASSGDENRRVWGGNNNKKSDQGGLTRMSPPRPMNKDGSSSSSSLLDTLKQTASNIPSFLHKGLTSLSSLTSSYNENPFHDNTFTSASEIHETHYGSQQQQRNPIVASVPGGYANPSKISNKQQQLPSSSLYDAESLEYFRNRPHLFGRGRNIQHPKKTIKGFRHAHKNEDSFPSAAPTFPTGSGSSRGNWRDSHSSGSSQHESILQASPSTWTPVGDSYSEPSSQMVPTEELNSSWKDYLFSSSEFGNSPGSTRTWRQFFGLAPAIEGSSMLNPTYGGQQLEGSRRRSLQLDRQWKSITSKYSKSEIEDAKARIHKYVAAGPESRSSFEENRRSSGGGAFEDLLKMFQLWFNVGTGRSPVPLKSYEHIQSEARASSSSSSSRSVEDAWTPVASSGKQPLISFSAGISFPTKNPSGRSHYSASPKPFIPHKYSGGGGGGGIGGLSNHITTLAHNYVGPTETVSYTDDLESPSADGHYVTSFTDEGADEYVPSSSDGGEVGSDDDDGYATAGSETSSSSVIYTGGGSNRARGSHFSGGSSLTAATLKAEEPPAAGSSSVSTGFTGNLDDEDSPYELVPSDVYFRNNKNPDLDEIAGVVKPAGVSDEVVKAHLPPEVAGIPTFSYPSQYRKNPPASLSNLQKYLTTADGKPMESSLSYKKRVDEYRKKEASFMLPQQFYDVQYSTPQHKQNTQYKPQQQQGTPAFTYPSSSSLSTQALNAIQRQQLQSLSSNQQTRVVSTGGDSALGFSDFELPANLDPDIAALLKTELDKDDVPEDIRKEFLEAKRQETEEKVRKQQQQQQQAFGRPPPAATSYLRPQQQQYRQQQQQQQHFILQNNRRSDSQRVNLVRQQQQQQIAPTFPLFHFGQNQRAHHHQPSSSFNFLRRNPPKTRDGHPSQQHQQQRVEQKFFAPIPISPTTVSQTLKGRYQSPVPRYVVELAKKLQRDKDVQGIVRVSTKRGNGPPIEYLYPVRG